MPVRSSQFGESTVLHTHDLSSPDLSLNVTAPLWALKDGEASEVRGLDVVSPRIYRPDRGRKSVGVSLAEADRPVSSVVGINTEVTVTVPVRGWRDKFVGSSSDDYLIEVPFLNTVEGTYNPSTGVLTETEVSGRFTEYHFVPGDVLLVHATYDTNSGTRMDVMCGVLEVFGKVDADNIQLAKNLASVIPPSTTITVRYALLAQGKQIGYCHSPDYSSTVPGSGQIVLVKSEGLYKEEGGWDSSMVGKVLYLNGDGRAVQSVRGYVEAVFRYAQERDSLALHIRGIMPGTSPIGAERKIISVSTPTKDVRGLLVSNGRKFWLLSGGSYVLQMDLGSDDFLGARWRAAKIASNRLLLVTPGFAPRVLHFHRNSTAAGDESLAGCIPPKKPDGIEHIEEDTVNDVLRVRQASWFMGISQSDGNNDDGVIRAMVRLVNLVDGIYSDFVPVVAIDHTESEIVTPTWGKQVPTGGTYVSEAAVLDSLELATKSTTVRVVCVFPATYSDGLDTNRLAGFTPPIHSRATYLELWRTKTAENVFFLERRVEIASEDGGNERIGITVGGSDFAPYGTLGWMNPAKEAFNLPNEDLGALPVLSDAEFEAGGLPPVCQDVVSILGTTICCGKAGASVTDPTIYAKNFFQVDATYDGSTKQIQTQSQGTLDVFELYTLQDGDQFVVLFGGAGDDTDNPEAHLPEGVYDIEDRISDTAIELDTTYAGTINWSGHGTKPGTGIIGYIRRAYTIDWPKIQDDEEIWYSRMDVFAPENFPPRVLTLSRTGDTFRRVVRVGNLAIVVMDQGVHVLYKSGVDLLKETFENSGTPWKDSVLVVGESVMWATPQGIRVLKVSGEVSDQGKRGQLGWFENERFSSWFQDALDDGDVVDAGFDSRNSCLRFRRRKADHVYEVLQFSFITGRWTLLDDDNGLAYASSSVVEETEKGTISLYSVDSETGAAFEVNYRGDDHPYDGFVVQGSLSGYTFSTTSIKSSTVSFTASMVGEIVRFRSTDSAVNDETRTILTASSKQITFGAVPGLSGGDTFVIGATRFRLKYAHLAGVNRETVKTLKDLAVHSYRGQRGSPADLTLRSYRNFRTDVVDSDTVGTFDEGETGKTSQDRVSSLDVQGSALELEVEQLDAGKDFTLAHVGAGVLEESSRVVDSES